MNPWVRECPDVGQPLKTFFSKALVRRLAGDIARVYPGFPVRGFTNDASRGLDALELLDRGRHIADALARHLPPAYPEALEVLLQSLGPEHATDELIGVGMAPFFYLPHTLFVAERGLEHFDLSMQAQYELTKRFSAEASIRPYISRDPERAMVFLQTCTADRHPHVRRLVSEGTRLRLPWAPRVAWLDRNPERVLALLERLKDDPSTMVRRSVANNLNDPGKVRPELLIRTAGEWRVPSSRRMTVVSMCQISSAHVVRMPTFGFAGCTRSRGRRHPKRRTRRYQVEGEAQTRARR